MEIKAFLGRHRKIALDTSVFIYSLERNLKYLAVASEILAWVEKPGHAAVTSTVTFTELVVKPYRTLEHNAVRQIYGLLLTYPNLEWIAPDLKIAGTAAQLRAVHKLETPDALQAATAIGAGATAMVTNDVSFERISAFETLLLDRLL